MKCAIVYRGICRGKNLHPQTNRYQYIDYKRCIDSVKSNLIKSNPDVDFDVYAHGWIDDLDIHEQVTDTYNTILSIFEKQIDFSDDYKNIEGYDKILQERYSHLHGNADLDRYKDINFQNYFQSIFSYAYSMSQSAAVLARSNIKYDRCVFLRYDCSINQSIDLQSVNPDKFWTDVVGVDHSPLFYGDFLAVSSVSNIIKFKEFYNFLKTNIFNNKDFIQWCENMRGNKHLYNPRGRYNHGIYSNQVIYAYFLKSVDIDYTKVFQLTPCSIIKQNL